MTLELWLFFVCKDVTRYLLISDMKLHQLTHYNWRKFPVYSQNVDKQVFLALICKSAAFVAKCSKIRKICVLLTTFFFVKSNYFFLLSAGKNPFEIQFFSKVVAQFLPIFRALYGVDVDVVAVRSVVLTVVFSKPFSIWLLNSKFSKKYVVIHCTYINIVAHNI